MSGYASTGKQFSIAFIINFPEEKKQNSLFRALIKREILKAFCIFVCSCMCTILYLYSISPFMF